MINPAMILFTIYTISLLDQISISIRVIYIFQYLYPSF